MKNFINAAQQRTTEFIDNKNNLINEVDATTAKNIHWSLKELVPPSSAKKDFKTVEALKDYLRNRVTKKAEAKTVKALKEINHLKSFEGCKITSIVVSIEWKKSRMWGMNPKATANVEYVGKNGDTIYQRFESSRVGGCGYDKESTAFAQAVNQIKPLMYLLAEMKNKNFDKGDKEIFTYGVSAYNGHLPTFSGGVGTSCYYGVFESCGFRMVKTAGGKTFDVYSITRV
jgi:hypothetical protein